MEKELNRIILFGRAYYFRLFHTYKHLYEFAEKCFVNESFAKESWYKIQKCTLP